MNVGFDLERRKKMFLNVCAVIIILELLISIILTNKVNSNVVNFNDNFIKIYNEIKKKLNK